MSRTLVFGSFMAIFCALSPLPALTDESPSKHSRKHLVLRTDAGDLVFKLHPEHAPRHTERVLRLVQAGVYDGTHFSRLHPGFVLQLSNATDRSFPLSASQRKLIHPIPAEFNSTPHRRGVLSMAREPELPDSALTSFSILLGSAPHLDGQYTVFGELVSGESVLQELERAPIEASTFRPQRRLEILKAEVIENERVLVSVLLRDKIPLFETHPRKQPTENKTPNLHSSVSGPLFLITCGLILFFGSHRWSRRVLGSIALLCVLLGTLLLLSQGPGFFQGSKTISGILLLGLILVFRLMGQFESSSQPKKNLP